VDCPRHQFFPCAAFACDEYRGIGGGDSSDDFLDFFDRGMITDHMSGRKWHLFVSAELYSKTIVTATQLEITHHRASEENHKSCLNICFRRHRK
jgi:hypothetical protein